MDNGPFRAPRSADRSAHSRSTPPEQREVEEPIIVDDEPKPVYRSSPTHRAPKREEKSNKKLIKITSITAGVLVVLVGALLLWSVYSKGDTGIDSSKYQAILLTNGESYIGKLDMLSNGYMQLTDVFYLKPKTDVSDTSQQKTTDQNDVQLIKFGDEVQGPEDKIVIAKDQIVYYQNLKTDGKVTQKIEEFKNPN